MIRLLIILLISALIRLSSCHLGITPTLTCEAAKTCNHTFIAICGQNQYTLGYRLFMDECDMYEYNCKYQAEYVKVEVQVCWHECTHDDPYHTPGPKTTTCGMSSPHPDTPLTTTEQPTTLLTTTEQPTTTTEETTTTTTTTTTTEAPTTEQTTTEPTTTEPPTTEESTVTEYYDETTEATTTPTTTTPTTTTTTTTESTTTTSTTESTTTASTKHHSCNPKDCFIPSTWETTPETEKRDFVQLLKERFGDNIKIIRGSTHYPTPVAARAGEAFLPGEHAEQLGENDIYQVPRISPVKRMKRILRGY
ncbi:uncharacterized protein LOC142982196 [Anticarsia gemmatalis]|uniref:uncharacterized protein LOC142982196 n=1 Tax=Anticarsia gemmatalis TaxID=129554 RepID=UPI003F76947E